MWILSGMLMGMWMRMVMWIVKGCRELGREDDVECVGGRGRRRGEGMLDLDL